MPMLKGFRATSLSTLLLKRNPHAARNKIHKNIDPSWALQIEEIL